MEIFNHIILNKSNPVIKWLINMINEFNNKNINLDKRIIVKTTKLLIDSIMYETLYLKSLTEYLKGWKNIPEINLQLLPPDNFQNIKENLNQTLEPSLYRQKGCYLLN